MKVWGIVVAAGSGERFGGGKHNAEIAGKPLWQHARDVLVAGGCQGVVVVGDVPGGVAGGRRRQDSVANGLAQVPADVEVVLVHDAARPAATSGLVAAVIDRLRDPAVDGVVPALSVTDTIKTHDAGVVTATPPRAQLVAAQTPQGFRADVLRSAHRQPGDATDDAELVERAGGRVVIVDGETTNFKLTYREDIERMRRAWRSV
jgi:2-C-methyl-D-erythritol 4-phosphate cytidylyltransferase